ncbi:hypothetical protein EZS27_015225 [termite gut metagenome]|uniref:Transposase IS701-like DDE domain-containing protein n=1 Tax=termite gut metagenome TaxID=433724 RepID=A0A5J4RUF5_9ZZZZ
MERDILDLYSDYLLVSTQETTAIGLSELVEGAVSHDQITRFLAGETSDGKALWLRVKKLVRHYESHDACLIFDDTIVEKAYMEENETVCWHWDHSKGRTVKGMNILTAFYTSENERGIIHVPVTYQPIAKSKRVMDFQANKTKRVSPVTGNEMMREMISGQITDQVKFSYILADSRFASGENMRFIRKKRKTFLFEIKDNRLIATDKQERSKGHFIRIDQGVIPDETPIQVWLKDLEFPAVLFKQVFFKQRSINRGSLSGN